MSEEVKVDVNTYKLLEDINLGLRALITLVFEGSDSRLYGVLGTLSQAVWRTDQEIEALRKDDEDRPLTTKELRNLLNTMQGRVLTVIEAVFGSPMQCEAVKSLARQKIWWFYGHAEEASS